MKKLADRLKKGFNVVDMDLIGMAYNFLSWKKQELNGELTIVLAYDAGVSNLKKLFPNRKIVQALDTVGLGAWNEKGDIILVKEFE